MGYPQSWRDLPSWYNRDLISILEKAPLDEIRTWLRTALPGLLSDRERLDWLEAQGGDHYGFGDVTPVRSWGIVGALGSTIRETIDIHAAAVAALDDDQGETTNG